MITFPEFDRNYYHLFEISKKNQNQMLFNQGEINNNIYFLKQGEVSVSLEGSISTLNISYSQGLWSNPYHYKEKNE